MYPLQKFKEYSVHNQTNKKKKKKSQNLYIIIIPHETIVKYNDKVSDTTTQL